MNLELLIGFVHKYVEQDFLPNINNNPYLELVDDIFSKNHYLIFENLFKEKKINLHNKYEV